MTDLAVRELQAGSSTGPSWEMLEIAKIYTSGGEYYRALQALKRAISGVFSMDVSALPLQYWQGLFPRPWWDALRSYSQENGLDPYMVGVECEDPGMLTGRHPLQLGDNQLDDEVAT